MAKKRKVSRKSEPSGPREIDAKDARLTIKTYEDVANSEDEFYDNQDRIDFDDDDGPRSKRLKRQEREEAFLEASDEEVFEEDESDESEEENHAPSRSRRGKRPAAHGGDASEGEEQAGEEEEGDEGWWGSSRKEYYNADNIETEADALVGFHGPRCGESGADMHCRKKRQRPGVSRPRSWPRWRKPTLPLTRASG